MSSVRQTTDPPSELDGLQHVKISSLQPVSSLLNKYVKGHISVRWPLVTSGKRPVLKLVIQEAQGACINIYTFCEYAESLDKYKIGDIVYISNAVLERSHTFQKDQHHLCHLIVDKKRSHPLLWVQPQNDCGDASVTLLQSKAVAVSAACTASATTSAATAPTTARSIEEAGTSVSRAMAADPAEGVNNGTDHQEGRTGTCGGPSNSLPEDQASPARHNHARFVQITDTGNASPKKELRTYTYTPLAEVKEANSIDVYGVVKFFKPPYKTKGPDYCMLLTIVDPSVDSEEHGLKCVLFKQEVRELPNVHRIGDIVRLHRLKVKKFGANYQGIKGNGFSCLVFDGKPGTPIEPRSSSPGFTFSDEDKKKVEELRKWAVQQTAIPFSSKTWTLSQIVAKEYFDLICQVVAVAIIPSESCVLLKVWDGTKCKWPVRCLDVSQVQVKWDTELACRAEGLMVDVALYDNHMVAGQQLKPGDFVRLYNLHAAPYTPPPATIPTMIELVLHRGTSYGRGLATIAEWEEDVRSIKNKMLEVTKNHSSIAQPNSSPINGQPSPTSDMDLDWLDVAMLDNAEAQPRSVSNAPESLDSDQEPRCMQKSASVITANYDTRFSTLQQVLDSSIVFRTKARVVDYQPRAVEEFVSLFCPKCRLSCRIPEPVNGVTFATKQGQSKPGVTTRLSRKRRLQDQSQTSPSKKDLGHPRNETPEKASSPTRRSQRLRQRKGETRDPPDKSQGRQETPQKVQRRQETPQKGQHRQETPQKVQRRQETPHKGQHSQKTPQKGQRRQETPQKVQRVTAVVQPTSGDGQERTISLAYIQDLTVQDSLSLMQQGLQLQRVPKVLMRDLWTGARGNHSAPTMQLYTCPVCCPDQAEDAEVVVLQYRYWLKLCLQDASKTLDAILEGQDAELFFGVPASNLLVDEESKVQLEDQMMRLCPLWEEYEGMADAEHPKMECCLEPRISSRRGERTITYYLRDTRLALDVE
ncbi:uncharacterized protein [Diadema setosum]|uniref:uncharacterized protein n=1 Tax=Diadema setosum TaxID=31175 RepID=UPI003B3B056E